jgi:hypothetical protein
MLSLSLRSMRSLRRVASSRACRVGPGGGGGDCGGDCDCGVAGRTMKSRCFSAKTHTDSGTLPDEGAHATGLRLEEYEDEQAGAERFNRSGLWVATPGTAEDPTLIPSMMESRVVGMEPYHGAGLKWFNVTAGVITRCPYTDHHFTLSKELAQQPLAPNPADQ